MTDIRWHDVCALEALPREDGVVALVDGEQVALIRTCDDEVFAVAQRDPYSGACVMARGIVGSRGGVPTLASPMYKQVFDLRTGECLDTVGADARALTSWPVEVERGRVRVGAPVAATAWV